MMQTLLQGGYLSLWGVAMLLCWVATLRLVNIIHCALAANGRVRAPHHVMPPMHGWGDLWVTLVALACGFAGMIAFAGTAVLKIPFLGWITPPPDLIPWLRLLRVALALVVMVYFLTRVDEHPRHKLAWAACWCAASFALVSLA